MSVETAYAFPGIGTQEPEMLTDFLDAWPEAEAALDRFEDDELRSLLVDGDEQSLQVLPNMLQTVLATSLTVLDAARDRFGNEPDVVCGHSLGHITATGAADMLSRPDVASFAVDRGEAVAAAEEINGPGKMVAVSLVDRETITEVVDGIDGVGVGAYNGPRQAVISGRAPAVEEACDRIDDASGRIHLRELDIPTGPHSPMMEPVADRIGEIVRGYDFSDPSVPVVSDVNGEPYETATAARKDLSAHPVSPVRWMSVVEELKRLGVERVVEFPPAGVLTDLIPRIEPDLEAVALHDPADAAEVFGDD